MGFGGSSSGANVIFKNNRRERKSKTDKFQKSTGSGIKGIKSEEVNSAEILEIRRKIRLENKRRQRKLLIFSTVSILIFIIIFWKVMF
ncbi:hypothetical protein APR41_16450 [Salegentibacter salinarum]|uniref:Uncharacterized protein n=1 Tax=Salegentibacter salinarum TaxID=447422 RepID=A0A2N0TWP4_9FLAO|nr:hypothetical protein APR41_16450 [Salegentibacter salinarum]SKB94011.1 hypothetical protein SAMN05660903_03364 [Salegentibacter salinarum]